jgi:Domain of Unknown Function (DUF748)
MGGLATTLPHAAGTTVAATDLRSDRMRRTWWIGGALVLVVALVYVVGVAIDEPMRRRMERDMNRQLKGYTVRIRALDLQPLDLGVELDDVIIIQQKHPEPPVAHLARVRAGVQWGALLHGRVVADLRVDRPRVYLNLTQVRTEATDPVPVTQRGWQDAVREIHPFKINRLDVVDGELTYIDGGPLHPLYLSGIALRAGNLQNVRAEERYPSDVHLEAVMLKTARLRIDGHADFLAKPYAGFDVQVDAENVDLGYLAPALRHANVDVRGGTLSARGTLEYGPRTKILKLATLDVNSPDLDYERRRPEEAPVTEQASKAAARVTNEPVMTIDVARLTIANGQIGYRDKTTTPPYALYLSDARLTLTNFSNRGAAERDGTGRAELKGRFMNSGDAGIYATFRPTGHGTDIDADLRIENTELSAMNDLWRAYGKFDVEKGTFSFYSGLSVRNNRVDGYVKPFFYDIDIFDPKEPSAGVGQKVYEAIVGGAATLLENHSRDQVATETPISGRLDDPRTSTLQVLAGLIRNAFFQAILPGLEKSRSRG